MRISGGVVFALFSLVVAGVAVAASPTAPTITQPSADGVVVNPADVHMEAPNFFDADGDTHVCSEWQIWSASPAELVWESTPPTSCVFAFETAPES